MGIYKTNSAHITPASCKIKSSSSQHLTWVPCLSPKNCSQIKKNPQIICVHDHIEHKPPPIHSSSISTYLDYNSSESADCSEKDSLNYFHRRLQYDQHHNTPKITLQYERVN